MGEALRTAGTEPSRRDEEALELGRKVLAIQAAIENPEARDAMGAITDLGLDARHYMMVRGWLSEQLRADRSVRDAYQGQAPARIEERIEFLQRAIRAIDLE